MQLSVGMLKSPATIGDFDNRLAQSTGVLRFFRSLLDFGGKRRTEGRLEQRLSIENRHDPFTGTEQMHATEIDLALGRLNDAMEHIWMRPVSQSAPIMVGSVMDQRVAGRDHELPSCQTCQPAGQRTRTLAQQPCKATISGLVVEIRSSSALLLTHLPFTLQVSTRMAGPAGGE